MKSRETNLGRMWVAVAAAVILANGCGGSTDAKSLGKLDAGGGAVSDPGAAASPAPAVGGAAIGSVDTSGRGGSGGATGAGGSAGGAPPPPVVGTRDAGAAAPADAGRPASDAGAIGNTNIALGGSQDFGYFRALLNAGRIPELKDFDAAGFFAEHHTRLPLPTCGERVCLQSMLAVLGNLFNGNNCTMLQLGLNSPIVADPAMRPPLTMAVSIDVSGSMNTDNKIGYVRAGLEKLIDGLRDTDKVALLTYSDRVTVAFPMAQVGLQRARLRDIARGLVATGGTNFYDGLEAGYREVLAHYDSGRQNRVIMLSDGQPTVGRTSSTDILAMSKRYNSDGVGLTTIGLGTDFNAPLMRTLAQQADGNFYFLENSGAVSEVFVEELSFFTVPVAYDLKLEMEAGSQYNFGRAYGSSFWTNTATGGRLEVPSVFLAHRKSHADQTVDGGRRGGGSALLVELMPKSSVDDGSGATTADVAVVRVSFREPGTNRIVSTRVVINYPQAPWRTPETGFFQAPDVSIIHKSFVMLNMYMAIEDAVRDFHQRTTRDTLGKLRRLVAAVVDYNEEIQDKDIEADLALLNQLMAVLRRNGVVDPSEVRIPANPWPAD